ncbi:glycosyltransferase family 9 protein [Aestuariibaculum suncheonense]|uniref:Glycosyltransferase family 9 protein n=1 Tax=Aestuariibaculum suncheonense TaxID=1028745 RepID=A0A8J6QHL9_9FLAO|nr:glycosyltransferase family 9 protein [Aestuariibaculum suncheonense]MBD0835461.1 glycosyltransferase family 9 protein [Aestuariibaculum suncheonense]
MSFKIAVNNVRRSVMHSITKNVGSSYKEPEYGSLKPEDIKRVLIIRPNHRLGNQILLTSIVQEVIETFPNCKIDLFVKGGVAFPVFENYTEVNKIIQLPRKPFNNLFKYAKSWASIKNKSYDLVINGDKDSSSGRLLTQLSRAKFKVFGDVNEAIKKAHPDHRHISKYTIYNLRYFLKTLGVETPERPLPTLNIKLSDAEIAQGKAILDGIIKNDKPTICIYTNATGAKCYSYEWWGAFYERLLQEFPEYNIIEMLPIENISRVNFKAPNFYSKDIREMGGVLHNTAIFIAADNGVMHLAAASMTPTVGFFSVTDEEKYGPYGNSNIAINTNHTQIDDWMQSIHNILK